MKLYGIMGLKTTAANGRFGAMAAIIPQTILWEFARYYPAASSVEAATAQSRRTLAATIRADNARIAER